MKKLYYKLKLFWQNMKKLYQLSKMVSYEDNGETIMFSANIESTKNVRAWNDVVMFYEYERNEKLKEGCYKKAKELESNVFKKEE